METRCSPGRCSRRTVRFAGFDVSEMCSYCDGPAQGSISPAQVHLPLHRRISNLRKDSGFSEDPYLSGGLGKDSKRPSRNQETGQPAENSTRRPSHVEAAVHFGNNSPRRHTHRVDTFHHVDSGTSKSTGYESTVQPGDSVSQRVRLPFVKPEYSFQNPFPSRRLSHQEKPGRRCSRDDNALMSPKSTPSKSSYGGKHGSRRHKHKKRHGNRASFHVEEASDNKCHPDYRDNRITYYGDRENARYPSVVPMYPDTTSSGSEADSERESANDSSGGSSADTRIRWGRLWKEFTYGDSLSFQYYDFGAGVKSEVTPEIGEDGVSGVAERDDTRRTLVVTEGRVDTYVKVPRLVFVEPGKGAIETFKKASLERLKEYAESLDNEAAPPMPGDENKRGFWVDPATKSLMVGRGTVERTVLDVEIAYLGSVESSRRSRAREAERKRDEQQDYEDLCAASRPWDSFYDESHRSANRNRYYRDNDRYGRHN